MLLVTCHVSHVMHHKNFTLTHTTKSNSFRYKEQNLLRKGGISYFYDWGIFRI